MFILDVSCWCSFFISFTSAIGFFVSFLNVITYDSFVFRCIRFLFMVVELVLAGGAPARVGASQLHLICGSVSAPAIGPRGHRAQPRPATRDPLHPPRDTHATATRPPRAPTATSASPRRPTASLHADKAFHVVLETSRPKPLRFWALGCMHWLMWTVTRFRFLSLSETASPGRTPTHVTGPAWRRFVSISSINHKITNTIIVLECKLPSFASVVGAR